MEQNKEYYAFISYKREDEEWAKWLQNELEHYKFPTNLNGRTDLPKNIRPTFRDVTDSTPGFLEEVIDNALRKSEWLIVICSPRSAKSPWVCKEAQTFIDQGRADHIIPFIIEGNPFSYDVNTECYPDALLNLTGSKELLAANISEGGRDFAAVKVVARMFDLKPDTLWQRYEREQRRKRWMWTGIALLVGLVGLVIAGYFIKQNRTIENQYERLREDSVVMKNHLKRIQGDSIKMSQKNDSIEKQNKTIIQQKNDINKKNEDLIIANLKLKEERDNVLLANTRAIAEKANALIEEGDAYTARRLALYAYLQSPSEQPEIESVLRKALENETAIIRGHEGKVNKAIFSPDDKTIASISNDGTIRIWDSKTGLQKNCFDDFKSYWGGDIWFDLHTGKLYSKVSADTSMFKIRDIVEGSVEKSYSIKRVSKWSLSPKGNQLLTVPPLDTLMKIWELSDSKIVLKDSLSHKGSINTFSYNSDGNLLVVGTWLKGNSIYIWDMKKMSLLTSWKAHVFGVEKARFSSDGKKIISCGTKKLNIDLIHGSTTIDDDTIKVWDYSIGRLEKKYICKAQDVFLESDKNIIIAINRNDIIIIDINNGKQTILSGHKSNINSISFNKNKTQLVSASNDGTIRLWDMRKYGKTLYKSNPNSRIMCNPQSTKYLLTSGNKIAQVSTNLNANTVNFDIIESVHPTLIKSIAYSPDGRMYASASKAIVGLWNASKDSLMCMFRGPFCEVNSICFTKDGQHIIAAYENGRIRVWDIYSGREFNSFKGVWVVDKPLYEWNAHNLSVNSISISPDGKYMVSASDDKYIKVWDKHYRLVKRWKADQKKIFYVAYSPNGEFIISRSLGGSIKKWDAKTFTLLVPIISVSKDDDFCYPCIITPDSKNIIFGDKNQIEIVDIKKGILLKNYDIGDICSSITLNKKNNYMLVSTGRSILKCSLSTIDEIIKKLLFRYGTELLTPEEKRKYYVE